MNIENKLVSTLGKSIAQATNEELYFSLLTITKELSSEKEVIKTDRKLYYISAEFLIGKLLSNNLINLGIYEEVSGLLAHNGKNLNDIENIEPEPSLGNGGLGRLASCFLDSIATLGLSGDGIGLNYHFGLFKQVFEKHKQTETKNTWIDTNSWLTKTNHTYTVNYKDFSLQSTLYDIDIIGYENGINKLHLFDVETIDESIVKEGIHFDKTNIAKNLTLFLYPDDSDEQGHLLRIYQQYFMVSNGVQYILEEAKNKGISLHELDKHIVIQINDTHPTLVIPELISRLMMEGIHMREAIVITSNICAYTNHTILAEALEKWPLRYLQQVVPHLVPIIEALDTLVYEKYHNEHLQIIDHSNLVHMARIDMHTSFSINGVAAIHTDILKTSELKPFYEIYPSKFNNKTNGITFRRWLMYANHELSGFITQLIGDGWKKNADELEKLLLYKDNAVVLDNLYAIKKDKKVQLAAEIKKLEHVDINPESIFCIQIKRLHEYKRQQMNALYIINKYLDIKNGILPKRPITFIFGAKAAPAYITAKNIIHLLLCLQELINNDPEVSPYMKVIMVENYNVTYAEKLIPACDISEQISLASKEASGTGNMKFMLNGAITLGTNDGANVEIAELVGPDNIYTFGQSSKQVIEHYAHHDYCSKDYYETNPKIKRVVDFIIGDELAHIGDLEALTALFNELVNKDWFMTLLDLEDYIRVKDLAILDYEDQENWKKKMLVNIAKAGFFSSDRTINDYNQDIWKLK
ncbi:glycogen/starch/alpha-glucan phosphorylase [Anaerorhabdus sp.]|uniref:glycogen/starch/alpha-glucan phosphorylase n=1 Tax=Anaerorhabdus sp. TaxID=1872524 RepID=UPI002B1EBF7F|nr:glycogen/starch/alpha-glucan phosphorylase [Anaerorhabdus sp.]MEA4876154.1 glycogen/starch/alpha-glucan phosphorylase [Anaerorhabdus sp.]